MGIVSYFFLPDHNLFLTLTIFVVVTSTAGFFPYNYHPAIIYGGDTGALFIGFMISVLSLQGLKNATAVAVVTEQIEVRLANGLVVFETKDQIDTIIIAGMGGRLISDILVNGRAKLKSVSRLI